MTAVELAQSRGWRQIYFNSASIPFWGVHLAAIIGVAILGFSWSGLALALGLYGVRLFFVTGGYHRYFSHRSYKTSRWFQFVLAFCAQATFQKGVLWWAAHHRHHHRDSDQPGDIHSAKLSGFWWSHMGWLLSRDLEDTNLDRIKDFARYPELLWINRYWYLPGLTAAVVPFLLGGAHALIWGFFVSQTLCWHGTFTINSLSHMFGTRPYATSDDSRNNLLLAFVTLGEGWHNNHHHYQVATRQGFRWWQVDITFYVLKVLAALRLIWDLHGVPAHILDGVSKRPGEPQADGAVAQ
jgi:stearoyl-CoA desaturase (delta-9 desaturase)